MNDDIKKELIWRYKYIYSNIEYLVGSFLVCNTLREENDYVITISENINLSDTVKINKLVENSDV